MSKLNLVSISINNVLGIQEMEIKPNGNIVEISGRNGQGKTSIMEGIKDALGVSDYSQLLRNGESKGKTVLDLGDMVITKNYKPNGETTKLEAKVAGVDAMTSVSKPASVIKTLINPNSVDPVRLLTSKPKDLVDAVLGALPMTVTAKRMEDIFGSGLEYDIDEHALVVLSKQTARIMNERKLVNRDGKTFKTTADQLRATLPDNIPVTQELEDQINENLEKIEGIRGSARKAGREARAAFFEDITDTKDEIAELDNYIEDLEVKLNTAKLLLAEKGAKLEGLITAQTDASERATEAELDKADGYQNHNVELSNEISSLKVYENTSSQVRDYDSKIAEVTKKSNAMTNQLKQIDQYKSDLCQDLPIKGLEITDGKLSMDGIPFETMNTASRVDLVIELAKLSSGKLGLVILDNSEMLDSETYELFLEKASKTDLTFVVGRVKDHDLEVK